MNPALLPFRSLPLLDRLHLRMRYQSCPFEVVIGELPASGTVADVGCGHGLVCALAAQERSRRVVGVDPDERKIALARRCLAPLPNVEVRTGTAVDLPDGLDAITICDVLYLLPLKTWSDVLAACRERLRPGGKLVLKEAGTEPAWKWRKALLQERVMVSLLGRTKDSGGLNFQSKEATAHLLESLGFRIESVRDLGRGYTTAHVLFVAAKL